MKVGVLGGTRFIGVHLVEALLAQGAEVSIFHRGRTAEPRPFPAAVARFVGDRSRVDSLEPFFARTYDAVIDLTGYHAGHVGPLLSRWGGKIGHYIFCSTASVYRVPPSLGFAEDAPRTLEAGTYGGEKSLAEDAVLSQPRPATVFRPQAVFGPHDAPQVLHVLRRLIAGEPVLIQPRAAGKRLNPVWVGDLVDLFLRAIGRPEAFGQAFNAAGAEAATPESFGRTLERISGVGRFEPVELDAAVAARFPHLGLPWLGHDLVADVEKARKRLGASATPIEEALRRTWDWARAEPGALRLSRQRWEGRAREGRLPSRATEACWLVYDGLKANPIASDLRRAMTAAGLRSRHS